MRRSSRWFAIGAVAIFLAAAGPARAVDVEAFLPKESDAVVSINVRQLLDSDIIKKFALDIIKKGMKENQEAQRAFDALGLDPLKDFNRVTVGIGGEDATDAKAVIVVEGKFDPKKINDTAADFAQKKGQNIAVDKLDGKTIYKITGENQPNPLFAAVVDPNTIVLATTKEYLGRSFEAAQGNVKSELKKELADLVKKADPKATLFLVAATKGKLDKVPVPDPNVAKVLQDIESLTADLRVDKDIKLELVMGVKDDEIATALNGMVEEGLKQAQQFVPLIALQNPQLKPLGDMVNSIKTKAKGKSVVINALLPGDAIELMIKESKENKGK
jgi:Protein of unknown function (DUF3352)